MESYLQKLLITEIPLSRAIGLQVVECSPCIVRLRAPLENNINHKLTAFGGSLYCVAVLSCWSLLHLQLRQLNQQAQIVIQDSSVKYDKPVTDDIEATCRLESGLLITKMISTLAKKGRARILLQAIIEQTGQVAVQFEGRFVLHR